MDTHMSDEDAVMNPNLPPVLVHFKDHFRVSLTVSKECTLGQLHAAALAKIAKLDPVILAEPTVLQTTDANFYVLPRNKIADLLSMTENNTFVLKPVAPEATQRQHTSSRQIYIRWITVDTALSYQCLSDVPVDPNPVSLDISVSSFYLLAKSRLCRGQREGLCLRAQAVNLFLKECPLSCDHNATTLEELGLNGIVNESLDVFVEFVGVEARTLLDNLKAQPDPQALWGLATTSRGICTFASCLEIFFQRLKKEPEKLNGFLHVLLEVTHFPPLLTAFHRLSDARVRSLWRDTDAEDIFLVASAFDAMCKKIVPFEMMSCADGSLEGCRQVWAWLLSLQPGVSGRLTSKPDLQLVFPVHVAMSDDTVVSTHRHWQTADVPYYGDSGTRTMKSCVISMDQEHSSELCRLVAHAVHPSRAWEGCLFSSDHSWSTLAQHKRIETPRMDAFSNFVAWTNQQHGFRLVGPLQLGNALSSELPVITLSGKGYVSCFDKEDFMCGERRFVLHNPVEGRVALGQTDPGQPLLQQLEPIIASRKENNCWGLDAWADATGTSVADMNNCEEALVICVDSSRSMTSPMKKGWIPATGNSQHAPSRFTEVKELFKNLALRISASKLSTCLALIPFSATASVQQPLTPIHLNFHRQLEDTHPSSGTRIYDAIAAAVEILQELKSRHPTTKCRIIILTDGEDNRSNLSALSVCEKTHGAGIMLDAVVIGTQNTADLFKIARYTGGYAFHPKTQQELFQIALLDTVIDVGQRPQRPKEQPPKTENGWSRARPRQPDMQDIFDVPPCKPHINEAGLFFPLQAAGRLARARSVAPSSPSIGGSPMMRHSRSATPASVSDGSRYLLTEITEMLRNQHEQMEVYVSENNMGFWKIIMSGPEGSPYEKGTFLMWLEIPSEFPLKPPAARFVTSILHPNVTKHGRICHPIFDREWNPSIHIYQVLYQIYAMLMVLEVRDTVDPLASMKFFTDPVAARAEVEAHVKRAASVSKEFLRTQIRGIDSGVRSSTSTIDSRQRFLTPSTTATASPSPGPATPSSSATIGISGLRMSTPSDSITSTPTLGPATPSSASTLGVSNLRMSTPSDAGSLDVPNLKMENLDSTYGSAPPTAHTFLPPPEPPTPPPQPHASLRSLWKGPAGPPAVSARTTQAYGSPYPYMSQRVQDQTTPGYPANSPYLQQQLPHDAQGWLNQGRSTVSSPAARRYVPIAPRPPQPQPGPMSWEHIMTDHGCSDPDIKEEDSS